MHYTANLLLPAIFDKFKIFFFEKPIFFPKQLNLFDFFEKSIKSSCNLQSCILQQTCHHHWILKNWNFFRDNPFLERTQLLNVLRNLSISFVFGIILSIFSLFQKTQVSFSKKPSVFLNNPNFDLFEKSYCISCILQQICYHQHFLKLSIFFFGKPIYFIKKTQILIVFGNLTASFALDIKLVKCSFFQFSENWSFFFQKSMCFLSSVKWTFREIIILQSILWQVCYL